MRLFLFILFFVSFMALEVSSKELEIVKEHSKINFDIDYMLVTKVQGQFKEIQCAWKSDDEGN